MVGAAGVRATTPAGVVARPPASRPWVWEGEPLAFIDLVLRRVAFELPRARVSLVRAVDLSARVEMADAAVPGPSSAFEVAGPGVLVLPRVRRSLELLMESAREPLPQMVPLVTAASDRSATVATAGPRARVLGMETARRAADLHRLAPWSDREIESVSTLPEFCCQSTVEEVERTGPPGRPGHESGGPVGYLVFVGERDRLDLGHPRWRGVRVGLVRSPAQDAAPRVRRQHGRRPVSVGPTQYVLVDECP